LLLACGEKGKDPAVPTTGPTTGEAFGGVACSSVRPQTEPDLMAWDPGSRATLKSIKDQGVAVVRYEAEGCNVSLHVLPNCKAKGKYVFSSYNARDTKLAHDANELFAKLPLGAATLSGKLKGTRAIRADYVMAGVESVEIGTTFQREELIGECGGATHIVSKIYVGGFGLAAGESREIEGGASVFAVPGLGGIGGGAKHEAAVEHLQHEGSAKACDEALEKGVASGQCSVPLRVALMSLGPSCAAGQRHDPGRGCVAEQASAGVAPTPPKEPESKPSDVGQRCTAGAFQASKGCVGAPVTQASPMAGWATRDLEKRYAQAKGGTDAATLKDLVVTAVALARAKRGESASESLVWYTRALEHWRRLERDVPAERRDATAGTFAAEAEDAILAAEIARLGLDGTSATCPAEQMGDLFGRMADGKFVSTGKWQILAADATLLSDKLERAGESDKTGLWRAVARARQGLVHDRMASSLFSCQVGSGKGKLGIFTPAQEKMLEAMRSSGRDDLVDKADEVEDRARQSWRQRREAELATYRAGLVRYYGMAAALAAAHGVSHDMLTRARARLAYYGGGIMPADAVDAELARAIDPADPDGKRPLKAIRAGIVDPPKR